MTTFHEHDMHDEPRANVPSAQLWQSVPPTYFSASHVVENGGVPVINTDDNYFTDDQIVDLGFPNSSDFLAALFVDMPNASSELGVLISRQYISPIEDLFEVGPFAEGNDSFGTGSLPYLNVFEKPSFEEDFSWESDAFEKERRTNLDDPDLGTGDHHARHDEWIWMQVDTLDGSATDYNELGFDEIVRNSRFRC